jgi:pilus assembly protein TadC
VSAALCWLAVAVWLSRRRSNRARPGRNRSPTATRLPPAALGWLAAVVVGLAGVVALGPVRGGLGGLVAAPIVVRLVGLAQARALARVPGDAARRLPLVLDLLAAALRSGQPVVTAVSSVAPLAGADLAAQLHQVAGLLRFGADPATAWAALDDPTLAPVVRTAVRSAESGVRLARSFELLAAELRDEAKAVAVARAHRAGVWAMAPLGMCFLPAFACLGVLPVIVGIARGVLNVTP